MIDLPLAHIDLYEDRIKMLGELRLSQERMIAVFHLARQGLVMRTMLEQMANGGRSNADFAQWAAKLMADEKEARKGLRLRHPKRVVTLEAV